MEPNDHHAEAAEETEEIIAPPIQETEGPEHNLRSMQEIAQNAARRLAEQRVALFQAIEHQFGASLLREQATDNLRFRQQIHQLSRQLETSRHQQVILNANLYSIRQELQQMHNDLAINRQQQHLDVDLAEKRQQQQHLDVVLAEKRQQQQLLDVDLAEKRKQQQHLDVDLAEKRQQQQHLDVVLAVKRQQKQHLDVDLAEKRQQQQHLDVDLAKKRQQQQHLDVVLAEKRQQKQHLDVDLAKKRQQQQHLDVDLAEKRQQKQHLDDGLAEKGRQQQVKNDMASKETMDGDEVPQGLCQDAGQGAPPLQEQATNEEHEEKDQPNIAVERKNDDKMPMKHSEPNG